MSLTVRLAMALSVASFFVAMLVAMLGADRNGRQLLVMEAEQQQHFALQLADRVSPFLERGDLLRMSMLATAGRDLVGSRVVVLDRTGSVALDTSLVFGSRRLGSLTQGGSFQRQIEIDGKTLRESLVPIRFGGDAIGELRLQAAIAVPAEAFDFNLFGLVFLCCLTLVVVASMMGHQWSLRVRSITAALAQVASGQRPAEHAGDKSGELRELGQVLLELEKGVHDGLERVVTTMVSLATQVVEGMERRSLIPKGHGERTARNAALVAERIELQPADLRDLDLACRLQDLGKAWVRPALLQKQTELTSEEIQSLHSHPVRGADHLDALPGLRHVARMVRHQNERHDGTGMPQQLRGERIPLGSRILAIASAFDLWTTCGDQPLDKDAALVQMQKHRGEVFDPWLFDLFAEAVTGHELEAQTDKSVMIMPGGEVPYRLQPEQSEPEFGHELTTDSDLEVMLDDLPPEEAS